MKPLTVYVTVIAGRVTEVTVNDNAAEVHVDCELVVIDDDQWIPRPLTPGLYVCGPSTEDPPRFGYIAMELDEEDLKRGAPFRTPAVFGPIPKYEPEAT